MNNLLAMSVPVKINAASQKKNIYLFNSSSQK